MLIYMVGRYGQTVRDDSYSQLLVFEVKFLQ